MKFVVFLNFVIIVSSLNLHPDHISFVLHHHPELNESGINIKDSKCWGYETNCRNTSNYFVSPKNCANKRLENDFILRVDFGYIQQQQKEIMTLCKEKGQDGSTLKCSRYTRYCTGKNIFINFRALEKKNHDKFQADLFQPNEIGGFCKVDKELLSQQSEHKSPLQSWYAELENFSELDFHPMRDSSHCDLVLNSTVVFMKLDFGGNMFHHFCDFFNLYISQHVNNSWFGQDIHIVMWDVMAFNELLKELVKDYVCLFNQKIKVFETKEKKNAWEEICLKLNYPGGILLDVL